MKIRDLGEISLIERIAKGMKSGPSVIKGIGDDAAVIEWKSGKCLLYTCDMLVEDVHFKSPPATSFGIGWKAMARNLSDIAAMGGIGKYAVVSVGIDPGKEVSFVDGIYNGLRAAAGKFGVKIVGGDVSRSGKTIVSVSLIGEVERRFLAGRDGAREGDLVLVTGSFGGSIKRKHLSFTPRIREARALVTNFKISSMIDVSDGLILDLSRLLKASRAGARVDKRLIPVSADAKSVESALNDGEDFELLFTMSASEAERLIGPMRAKVSIPISVIGEITKRRDGLVLVGGGGKTKRIDPKGYLHF